MLGRTLESLLDAVVDEPELNTRDELLARAKAELDERPAHSLGCARAVPCCVLDATGRRQRRSLRLAQPRAKTRDDPENVDENRAAAVRDRRRGSGAARPAAPGARRGGQPRRGGCTRGEGRRALDRRAGVPMLAFSADCLPIALARTERLQPALALLHAGRLGLLAGIVEAGSPRWRTSSRRSSARGSGRAATRSATTSPTHTAPASAPTSCAAEPRSLDRCGEGSPRRRRRRVERLDVCTACAPDRFFSHRRDGAVTRPAGSDRLRRLRRFARTTNGSAPRSGRL